MVNMLKMWKKVFVVFFRDIKSNSRDFISIYILAVPIIFAVLVNLLVPSLNETSVSLAVVDGENPDQQSYFEAFAKVKPVPDVEGVEQIVRRRDDVIGVVHGDEGYYLLRQGDEPQFLVDYAALVLSLFQKNIDIESAKVSFHSFGNNLVPIKKFLVNMSLLLFSVLGGMLIGLNIVEEKVDNTVSAINLSPISRIAFIFGKSIIGVILPVYGTVAMVLIAGIPGVNLGQLLIMAVALSFISIIVGFLQGLKSTDVMEVAGSIKLLFLPLGLSIAGLEFLSQKWQWLLYWSPWYWAYKANALVLDAQDAWGQVLMSAGIVLAITIVIFAAAAPKIRRGLE
ncbi:MAG: ABC transporter permease [Spirochaetales bacterium]|nr:ABC transporter permease [Spirochaetales bacterium]